MSSTFTEIDLDSLPCCLKNALFFRCADKEILDNKMVDPLLIAWLAKCGC